MESRWSDREAAEFVARLAPRWGEDLALRVYTSRLIGRDPDLVLHGGGNTSLKGTMTTLVGERVEALFVKGSGWDLVAIEPPGLPAVDLVHLRKLRALAELSDEEMVNQLRTHLFDAGAPNPSVETLGAPASKRCVRSWFTISSSDSSASARSLRRCTRSTAGSPGGSIATRSQPLPLTNSASTRSPTSVVSVPLSEVLPPPCSTRSGSRPIRREARDELGGFAVRPAALHERATLGGRTEPFQAAGTGAGPC